MACDVLGLDQGQLAFQLGFHILAYGSSDHLIRRHAGGEVNAIAEKAPVVFSGLLRMAGC